MKYANTSLGGEYHSRRRRPIHVTESEKGVNRRAAKGVFRIFHAREVQIWGYEELIKMKPEMYILVSAVESGKK